MPHPEFKRTRKIEAWVCYSTISFVLYESWARQAHHRPRLFLAQGTPLLREKSTLKSELHDRPDLTPYTIKQVFIYMLASLLAGSRLVVRVPHLNQPTCNKHLLLLRKLRLIQLELYDDGFLGIVETPTVCKHLQPVFSSVYSWNIQGWQLSDATIRCLAGRRGIAISHLSLEDLCRDWRQNNVENERGLLIIIEAKYMDYIGLNDLINQMPHTVSPHSKYEVIPKYIEHPWKIKRNTNWPPNLKRDLVYESPIERYLFNTVNPDTHVVTGVTSSIVLLCDLINKGELPSCRVTLLLSTKQSDTKFHHQDELDSYISFMHRMYSSVVDLTVMLDGQRVKPLHH
jgi:hypothetical protein